MFNAKCYQYMYIKCTYHCVAGQCVCKLTMLTPLLLSEALAVMSVDIGSEFMKVAIVKVGYSLSALQ